MIIAMKGIQRSIFTQNRDGSWDIASAVYLTAYRNYCCKSTRHASQREGLEILARLERKGFAITNDATICEF